MKPCSIRWLPFAAVLLILAGAVGAQPLLTDPVQIMNEAYIYFMQGDQSLDAGRLSEAQGFYEQARDLYARLGSEFPGFEPRIVQYRKTYCDNQILDLARRQGLPPAGELPPLVARIPGRAPAQAPQPVVTPVAGAGDRAVEIDYLKSRLSSLEKELTELDALTDELERLEAANRALEKQLETANRKLKDSAGRDQEALGALQAELREREGQIEALQRELEVKHELDQALNEMEARLNELRAENAHLKDQFEQLDDELTDAEVRADQLELQATQLEGRLAAAEARAAIAEEELQMMRSLPTAVASAAGATELAEARPAKEKPKKEKAKKPAQEPVKTAAAKPEAKPAGKPAPRKERPEDLMEPKPIPEGMSAADFVRQLLQDGDNAAALATVRNARRAARTDPNLGLIEGVALIRLQRYTDAVGLLSEVAKSHPRNAELHATLGAALMGAGFYDDARDMLQMALRLDRHLPECHYNLAQLYAFIEPTNVKLAGRHYRTALDLGVGADEQLEAALK